MSVSTPPVFKIVKSEKSRVWEYLKEVWEYRHLILVFSQQQLKALYVQTKLNILWLVLRPLLTLLLFTFVFGKLIQIPGVPYPYALFAFTGLLIWNNFSFMVNNVGTVIQTNQALIKRMYFPRIILVFSKTVEGLVEVAVTVLLILVFMVFFRYPISAQIILLPLFIAVSMLCGLAIAISLNALTVKNRDLNQFVPTLVGFFIWLTPVFYPVTLIPAEYSFLVYCNPIAGAIQGCRWALLGDSFPSIWYLPSFIGALFVLIVGLLIFIRTEAELADFI